MKFKEYRVMIGMSVFGLIMLGFDSTFLLKGDLFRFGIGLLIILMVLSVTMLRFNMKVGKDYVVIYEFRYGGFVPSVLDFFKIKKIELKSKHKVFIHYDRLSKIYIVDGSAFVKTLEEKIKQYEDSLIDE